MLLFAAGCNTLPDCKTLNLTDSEISRLKCHSEYYKLNGTKYIYHNIVYMESDGGFESVMPISEHCYLEEEQPITSYFNATTNYTCMDYDNLNYTTLRISREEFEKLPCYRQTDWINGWCYPLACHQPNPPVCTAIITVMCFDLNKTPESSYFDHVYINKSKEARYYEIYWNNT